jgi:hypothetical protein
MKRGIAVVMAGGLIADLFAAELVAKTAQEPSKLTLRNSEPGDRIVAQITHKTLRDGTVCLAKEKGAVALAG